jgi:positive regulator of sigma E activity
MTQQAKVIKIENEKTFVLVKRTSACSGNCKSCSGCDGKKIITEAKNEVGACVGDDVIIFSDTKKTLYLAFKLYILPLIMLFAVLFLNEAFAFSPYILTFLILFIVALWIFVLKISKATYHQIVEVVSK